jgi:hypothetical protein
VVDDESVRAGVVFEVSIGLDIRLSGHEDLMLGLLGLVGIIHLHVGALCLLHIFPDLLLLELVAELILELAHVFVIPRLCTRAWPRNGRFDGGRSRRGYGNGTPLSGLSRGPASSPFRFPCATHTSATRRGPAGAQP